MSRKSLFLIAPGGIYMKHFCPRSLLLAVIFSGLMVGALTLAPARQVVGQGFGNSITGHVFGADRRPLSDINVELLDEFGRAIQRARTNPSGRYYFGRLQAARYSVRVLPFGTDYEEQEQSVEIVNFTRSQGSGDTRISGAVNEQKDFYLRPRKGVVPGVTGAVFAQSVPDEARKNFEEALVLLDDKKTTEAWGRLKTAIEAFPRYFAALELLGLEYVRAGHHEAARILLTIAVDVNPRGYKSWHGLAVALSSLKSYDQALKAAEKSIEINPIAPESLLLAGSLLRQAKSYTEAEKRLTRAREIAEGSLPDVHWELALLYAHGLKQYKDAARELKAYLKARPDDKEAENIKRLIVEFEEKAKTS